MYSSIAFMFTKGKQTRFPLYTSSTDAIKKLKVKTTQFMAQSVERSAPRKLPRI